MSKREKLEHIERLRKKYQMGGGPAAIAKVHEKGKLTARERIDLLVDPGSFREYNLWAQPTRTGFDIDRRDNPGDALVTGFARIDRRPVCIYAHDFSVLGGTQAAVQYWKTCKVIDTAVRLGMPYIGIIDSGGVRVQDAFGANAGKGVSGRGDVWYSPALASGIVPSISLNLGASYAGTAYSPFLADVFFMVKKPYCYMSLASPELLKSVTFREVTREEIGAPELHAEVTGSCDYLGESEKDVLEKARQLLGYLPSNCWEAPPIVNTGDDPERVDETLIDAVADSSAGYYDMHEIISRIVDNGDFLELKGRYAKNIIVGFARFGGRSVGICANNPAVLDGVLDLKAAEKEARFIRYCDAFGVPLIFFVDTPGFMADAEQERNGILRHAAMLTYALCEASVPKFTVYVGRCHNNGHLAMGTRLMGFDAVLAWPTADVQQVSLEKSIEAAYQKRLEEIDPAELEKFSKKYFHSPSQAAGLLFFDDIIDPKMTRPTLIDLLELAEKKSVPRVEKKHGNMPL
jgi:acetyl-CoA carboxylase carboxyltransferase component